MKKEEINVLLMTEILFIVPCVKYTRLSERIRNKNSSIKFDRIETALNFSINILDINEQWNIANGCRCWSNVETNLKKKQEEKEIDPNQLFYFTFYSNQTLPGPSYLSDNTYIQEFKNVFI